MLTQEDIASHVFEVVASRIDASQVGAEYAMSFEREAFAELMAIGRAVVQQLFEALDEASSFVDGDAVWRRAVTSECNYVTRFGDIRVARGRYRAERNGVTRCPVEDRLGILAGWTPEAARLSALLLTQVPSRPAARFFEQLGGLKPSRTRLDRLPTRLGQTMELHRQAIDAELRELSEIPENASTVAVSLDGVMVRLQGETTRDDCVTRANRQGRQVSGPIAHREASVASLSFYNHHGERLLTRRFARMPEYGKHTLESMLATELAHVRTQRPDLQVVALSDGAACNWRFLQSLRPDYQLVDAYHVLEHINRRLDRALGINSLRNQAEFAEMKTMLLGEENGPRAVFERLEDIEKAKGTFKPRKRKGKGAQPKFYERHAHRMRYREHRDRCLPIGSGVVEGTAHYMVVDRLRRSGMRWKIQGGQAVLSLRHYAVNSQFNKAWTLIMRLEAANSNWRVELSSA